MRQNGLKQRVYVKWKKKKWSRERFRVYCLKRRTLDKFFSTMKGDITPVIAYGEAKFNPNGKNELSSPTTYLSRRCAKFYPVIMIDEYNTTKVCADCDSKLCKVVKRKAEGSREVRGLRWCCSTKCRTFKDRDANASLNILRCFESGVHRPHSLSRNYDNPKGLCRLDASVTMKTLVISGEGSRVIDKAR